MKKLIALALLIVGTTIVAQEKKGNGPENKMEQFTPEQKSQIMLKKLTLELDLTDAQQNDLKGFISDKMAKKEAYRDEMKAKKEKGIRPTNDERFDMKKKMLDEQIAFKQGMQKILTPKQFEKWESLKENYKGHQQRNRKGERQGKPNEDNEIKE